MKKKTLYRSPDYNKPVDRYSAEERAQLEHFKDKILSTQMDFVKFKGEGGKWLLDAEKKGIIGENQMNAQNTMYQRYMLMSCIAPVSHGLSVQGITQAVGMYVGMVAVSPQFRRNINGKVGNVLKQYGGEGMQGIADKLLANANGGRVKFTPDSAACQKLKMMDTAFMAMREKGANIAEIQENYQGAMEMLDKLARADGVSPEQTNQSMRTLIGKFIDADPAMKSMTAETAFGSVVRSDGEVETIERTNANGEQYYSDEVVWKGQYKQRHFDVKTGESVWSDYTGSFTARPPMESLTDLDEVQTNTINTHVAACGGGMQGYVSVATTMNSVFQNEGMPLTQEQASDMSVVDKMAYKWYAQSYNMGRVDGFDHNDVCQYMVDNLRECSKDFINFEQSADKGPDATKGATSDREKRTQDFYNKHGIDDMGGIDTDYDISHN